MARSTNVIIRTSTISCIDMKKKFEKDENNKPKPNFTFTMKGKPNMASAQRQAITLCKHKNVIVVSITENENETYKVSAESFIANSFVCEDGKSYGHEYITREFVLTYFDVTYVTDDFDIICENICYNGKTTLNKLINYAREYFNASNVAIDEDSIETKTMRRYMTKEKYMEIGKKETKNNEDNEENEENDEE